MRLGSGQGNNVKGRFLMRNSSSTRQDDHVASPLMGAVRMALTPSRKAGVAASRVCVPASQKARRGQARRAAKKTTLQRHEPAGGCGND